MKKINLSNKEFKIEKRKLKVAEFQFLRNAVGWGELEDDVVAMALEDDLFSIAIMDGNHTIAIGRVIGDGAIYFYVQDIIVLEAYRRQGIGELIMKQIEAYLDETARHNSFVGLMSAAGVSEFYERFGYKARPEKGPGMFKVINRKITEGQ